MSEFDPSYAEMIEKHEQDEIGDFFDPEERVMKLSEKMLNNGMYPGIVEKWADEVAALEAKLSKMERALREIEAIDDPDDMGWIQAYVDWAFGRPYDKRLDRPDAWMKGNRPEALA